MTLKKVTIEELIEDKNYLIKTLNYWSIATFAGIVSGIDESEPQFHADEHGYWSVSSANEIYELP